MNRTKRLLVVFAAAFALGAFSASPAFAATPQWLIDGSAVSANTSVTSSGTLDLKNVDQLGVTHELRCTVTTTGTVGANGTGGISTIQAQSCFNSNCPGGSLSFNVPWSTQLYYDVSGNIRDTITNANHNPGWTMSCGGWVISQGGDTNAAITNSNPFSTVNQTFDALSPTLHASDGGTSSISGTLTLTDSGHTLAAR